MSAEQVRLIQRARSFLGGRRKRGSDVAVDPECYLIAWANTPGNARLRRLAFGWRAEPARLLSLAKDVAVWLLRPEFEVDSEHPGTDDFDHLIVSWALPTDFAPHGIYSDRYLSLTSAETPRILWLLIPLGESLQGGLSRNVRVLRGPKRPSRRLSRQPSIAPTRRRLSGTVSQALSVAAAVQQLAGRGFRRIVMPYEGQPFQHAINLQVKRSSPATETIGYMHSVLPALPTDFLYRPGAPDRLLVNGHGQAEILVRHLGWPPDRVRTIPSLRYLRDRAAPFAGRILLPYSFVGMKSIGRLFEAYMRSAANSSMPRWEVRNHPVMAASSKHAALARLLQEVIQRFPNRISAGESVSRQTIIIGSTAAVLEALERGMDVVHVCTNPLFEKYSADIWTYLDVEELQANVYRYGLRERGAYIQFGESREAALQHLGFHE